jgi:predicted ATPase/Tfp pilus assembly protein PilF/DNA-binding XRE family transcriptional regulator
VRDIEGFRQAVRERRRAAGRTQQQLARAIGLHPHVLSHKLNERDGAVLTVPEVIAIVITMASWGGVGSRDEVSALLALMAVPPQAIPAQAWGTAPLADLPQAGPAAVSPGLAGVSSKPAAIPTGPAAVPPGPAAVPPGPAAVPAGSAAQVPGSPAAGDLAPGRLVPAPLPVPVTPLVGRGGELAEVTAAVAEGRLVTLTGTGGTGKTRLALEAARRLAGGFPDGVAFANMAPVQDPGLVGVTLVAALGLTPRAAEPAEAQLTAALGPARLLLVADNLEHLVEEAPLLGRLLAAAPGLRLLVTSRIPLRLYGEHQIRVPPLRLPGTDGEPAASEAIQLFIERARAVVSRFDPQGPELEATASICRLLDGLPLAIELAAARTRLLPPQELLARLKAQPALLSGGPRDVPHRQQTLRATLDWSHDLLTPPARGLFARVGVFAGSFDAAAAAAVADPGADPQDMLERLAALSEHSLAEVFAGGPPRFRLLQPVREYALARLAETGQADAVHQRHLGHYLALATQARAHRRGPQQGAWLDRLAVDFANIRAALDWAEAEADGRHLDDGLRLAIAAAATFWRRRGSAAEGALHLDRLLALQARHHTAAPATVAAAVLQASALAWYSGDYPAATGLARQGLDLCAALGDPLGQSGAHYWLAEAAMGLGDLATAETHFRSAFDLAGQAGDRWTQAQALNMLAQISRYQGRYDEAAAQLRRAQQVFQAAGDPDGAATVIGSLGEVARDAGKPDQARDLFRQALRASQQTRTTQGTAYTLEGLATVAAMTGDGRAALTYLGAAQALREQSASPLMPVDQAILDRFLDPALAALTPQEREQALAEGRSRPLDEVITQALAQPGEPAASPAPAASETRATSRS